MVYNNFGENITLKNFINPIKSTKSMLKQDLLSLILNSIRDSKVIVDNYDYFKQQNNNGLWSDYTNSLSYLQTFQSYYETQNTFELKKIQQTLSNYYEPYVEVFSKPHPSILKFQHLGKSFSVATLIGLSASIFDSNFLYATMPVLIASLSCFGYSKKLKCLRQRFLSCFKKLNEEVKDINHEQLRCILSDYKSNIESILQTDYSYKKI